MRSAVLTEPRSDLRLQEREPPAAGPGEVVIRVVACGVCRSDVSLYEGALSFASYPRVPGHEVAGTVEAVGDGVLWPVIGTRVGMPWLYSSCGHCRHCIRGSEILCAERRITGVNVDGGYQEFMVAPADYVAPLPSGLEFAAAAPLMCAGLTVFSGLRRAEVQPGQRVAVIGLGGLGHLAVQYARAMGTRVAVVSSSAEKEGKARALGAELFVGPGGPSAGDGLAEWDGGAEIILATAPSTASVNEALAGLAEDGTMVLLGVGPGTIEIPPRDLIMSRRRIIGVPSGSRHELRNALEFAARSGVASEYISYPLEAANEALVDAAAGRIASRAVLTID